MNLKLKLKHVMPPAVRQWLRQTWHRIQRDWRKSSRSAKPAEWEAERARAWQLEDFDQLLAAASSDFGIIHWRGAANND